ncbi:universal stress protein [Halomicrococcus sp. NG-SE-24]|uniref:universal stress protein n=1 Tax=Halomicrococcus sp. NG-SE-24 TaxID=3436928 RepID=UPI003D982149
MTLVVPFDGSELSATALRRAAEIDRALGEDVLVVSVVPEGNAAYARERGWLGEDEAFDLDDVVSHLRTRVASVARAAEFRFAVVDRYAQPGTIARRIRRMAKDAAATMVFVGSDDAGHVVTSLASVGTSVASDGAYDVVIVRNRTTVADGAGGRAAERDADAQRSSPVDPRNRSSLRRSISKSIEA